MKRLVALLSLVVVTLAACTPIGDDPNVLVKQGALQSGESITEFFTVPASLSGDLIYFELDQDNGLELTLSKGRGPDLESSDPRFFGIVGFGIASSALETQAIEINIICRGPCVIFERGQVGEERVVTLTISNPTNSVKNYGLYAFSDSYADSTEPENNDCSLIESSEIDVSSIVIRPSESYEGALETVEDEDCFNSDGSVNAVTLETFRNTAIVVAADVYDEFGFVTTLRAGPGDDSDSVEVGNSKVRVKVLPGNNRAGPSANSGYELLF